MYFFTPLSSCGGIGGGGGGGVDAPGTSSVPIGAQAPNIIFFIFLKL
jgi:hypothetical protein